MADPISIRIRRRLLRWWFRLTPTLTWPLDYPDLRLHITSEAELYTRCYSCAKEPETIEWIEAMSKDSVLYDIGANVGAYSLVAASRGIRVYSFEPAFPNYPRLCANIVLNRLEDRIVPVPVALGDRTGTTLFHMNNVVIGGSMHTLNIREDFAGRPYQPVSSLTALAMRLDDLVDLFQLPKPDYLKLDVDGTEWEVLQGAVHCLESVKSLLVERDTRHSKHHETATWIEHQGFRLESVHPIALTGPFKEAANCIWVRTPVAHNGPLH